MESIVKHSIWFSLQRIITKMKLMVFPKTYQQATLKINGKTVKQLLSLKYLDMHVNECSDVDNVKAFFSDWNLSLAFHTQLLHSYMISSSPLWEYELDSWLGYRELGWHIQKCSFTCKCSIISMTEHRTNKEVLNQRARNSFWQSKREMQYLSYIICSE